MLVKLVVPKAPSSVVRSLLWVLCQEKISLPYQRHIKISQEGIDGAVIYREEALFRLLPL